MKMNSNNQNTALLAMDMQTILLQSLPEATRFLGNVTKSITMARQSNIPVLFIIVEFRTGMPEISTNNKGFTTTKERLSGISREEWIKIDPPVKPMPGEIVITKRRISVFTGLEVVLQAKRIEHIVLSGISTSGVVL